MSILNTLHIWRSRESEAFLFSHTVGVYRIDLRSYVYISIAVGKYRVDFLIKGNISTICTKPPRIYKSTCAYFLVQARKISRVILCYLVAEKSEGLGDVITVAFW